jgi:hypothetical protein
MINKTSLLRARDSQYEQDLSHHRVRSQRVHVKECNHHDFPDFVEAYQWNYRPRNDRNLLFGSRREQQNPGSISRLRASRQQLDSESDKRKAASIRHFGRRLSDPQLLDDGWVRVNAQPRSLRHP